MYWNHRVMKQNDDYGIVEVYYNSDGSIIGWTADYTAPYGDTVDELRESIEQMFNCLDKEILDEKELEELMKITVVEEEE